MDIQQFLQSGLLETYALGQGSVEERALVERMLSEHPEARAELEAIELDMEKLAMANAITPPPGIKARILDEIGNQNIRPEGPPIKGSTSPLRWLPLAASLLLAGYLGYRWNKAEQQMAENQAQMAAMTSRLNDCDTQTKVLENTRQAVAMLRDPDTRAVRMSNDKDFAYVYHNAVRGETGLDVSGLPVPPAGKHFQAWAIVDGKPVSLGMVDLQSAGGWQTMPFPQNATAFAISAEDNPQGNATPTQVVMIGNAG
ncbi:MAG: anti-sigma factor [Saprospiraceae bacterium]|nr:anti-sigma factor [Saprospiraceae bacterium]